MSPEDFYSMSLAVVFLLLIAQDASRLIQEGRNLLDQNRLAEAEAAFRRALERDPEDGPTHYLLGLTLLRRGDAGAAVRVLERARDLSAHPNAGVLFELGTAYVRTERLDDAEKTLSQAVALTPGRERVHLELGWVYYRKLDAGRAEAEFRRAIQIRPSGLAYFYLGLAETALGRVDPAASSFRRAVELDPGRVEAHVALGKSLRELGREAEADRVLRNAVALDPGTAEAHFQLGLLALHRGELEPATACFEKALASDPAHRAACWNLSLVYERLGESEKARSTRARFEELERGSKK